MEVVVVILVRLVSRVTLYLVAVGVVVALYLAVLGVRVVRLFMVEVAAADLELQPVRAERVCLVVLGPLVDRPQELLQMVTHPVAAAEATLIPAP